MCVYDLNGVLVVREGTQRFRWLHQLRGTGRPAFAEQWELGDLWPDDNAQVRMNRRITAGQPVLVVLDHESPRMTLPVDNVPRVPARAVLHDEYDDEFVTMSAPLLDWLNEIDRVRGQQFAERARQTVASTPRFMLPPLLLEDATAEPQPVTFVHTTGSTPSVGNLLSQVVNHLYAAHSAAHQSAHSAAHQSAHSAADLQLAGR